jgi:hypothetical protein
MNMQIATKHLISAWTKGTRLPLLGLGLLAISLAVLIPIMAQAATVNIPNGDVPGLIAAINTANTNPGVDTINLAPGGTYTLTAVDNGAPGPGINAGANGLPAITSQIAINGNGATIQRSSAASIPDFRIFRIGSAGDLTIDGVTIRGGRGFNGGGVLNDIGATLRIVNSTVTDNGGAEGGGIFNFRGTLTIVNSTISYNTGFGGRTGGGVLTFQALATSIINSTIFENRADGPTGFQGRGDAIADGFSGVGTLVVKNSILASPTQGLGVDCSNTAGGVLTSLGYNIASDASCGLAGTGDLNSTDPLLAPLVNNGGPTETHAPLPGSPAIDAVPIADCTDVDGDPVSTDQRGVARPQGAACDIGSVELTPAEAIQNLITTIGNMGLPAGVANSLSAPLGNINTNNTAAACNKLDVFISQVNAKVQNGQLTSAQASQLVQAANAIKVSLGCA